MCQGTSLVNRPCGARKCITETASTSVISLSIKQELMYPKFASPIRIFNISSTSVTLHLNMTIPGSVYCLAIPDFMNPPTSTGFILNNGAYAVTSKSQNIAKVTLSRLPQDFLLNIFCYTQSFLGIGMELSDVIQGTDQYSFICNNSYHNFICLLDSISVRTLCCKRLVFGTNFASVSGLNIILIVYFNQIHRIISFYMFCLHRNCCLYVFAYNK